MNDWPPSNYPFLIALLILTVTAVALAIGDDELAENLAIYVYYSLILGIAIRFLSLRCLKVTWKGSTLLRNAFQLVRIS